MEKHCNQSIIPRVIMIILGVTFLSTSVAFQKISGMGVDPDSMLVFGVTQRFKISYTLVFLLWNGVLTFVVLKWKRELIGVGTLIALFCSGWITEGVLHILNDILGNDLAMEVRILAFLCSLLLLAFASALCYTANLGVSPYDAQSLLVSEKLSVSYRVTRVLSDIACVGVGYLLGEKPGPATLIYAFCMGPFIWFFQKCVTDPLLTRMEMTGGKRE